MDPNIRRSVLKINTILKKTPTSIQLLARRLIESKPLSHSQPDPSFSKPTLREKQRLFDYGDPILPPTQPRSSSRYQNPLTKSQGNRSMDEIPSQEYGTNQPWYKPHSDPQRDLLLSDLAFNKPEAKTALSNASKESLRPDLTRSKNMIDWAQTPIYQEYIEEGVNKYNYKKHQAFYDEEEAPSIFKLLKSRYANSTDTSVKSVEPFFHKAMDTLGEIMGSFSLTHIYRAIQKIYTKADVQNTLKLVLRVQKLFNARYLLFEIFHDILEFKDLMRKITSLLDTKTARAYYQVKSLMDSLAKVTLNLQNNLADLTKNHPQVCKESFLFENKDWIVYAGKQFDKLNNTVAEHGISMEDDYQINQRPKYL